MIIRPRHFPLSQCTVFPPFLPGIPSFPLLFRCVLHLLYICRAFPLFSASNTPRHFLLSDVRFFLFSPSLSPPFLSSAANTSFSLPFVMLLYLLLRSKIVDFPFQLSRVAFPCFSIQAHGTCAILFFIIFGVSSYYVLLDCEREGERIRDAGK